MAGPGKRGRMRAERRADRDGDPLARVVRRSRAAMALESLHPGLLAARRRRWRSLWAALAFGLAEVAHPAAAPRRRRARPVLALLALLVRGVRRFRWPSAAAARARIDATLPGRPLAALRDAPALGRRRSRRRRRSGRRTWRGCGGSRPAARPVSADLRLAAHDPWALRLMALVALIAAAVFARDRGIEAVAGGAAAAAGRGGRHRAELRGLGRAAGLYRPADALPAGGRRRRAGVGARGHQGDAARLRRARALRARRDASPAGRRRRWPRRRPGIAAAEFPVGGERHGDAAASAAATLGAWSFAMEPDLPPTIALTGTLERAPTGETQLAYKAHDDHGIAGARAEIALDLPQGRPALRPRGRRRRRGRRWSPTCRCR